MEQTIITNIAIVGITISGLLALVFLWNRKLPYLFLGLLFLCICFQLVEEYFWLSHLMLTFPSMAELSEPTLVMIPPLLWCYVSYQKQNPTIKQLLAHFSPSFLFFLNFTPLYFQTNRFKRCYVQEELFDQVATFCPIGFDEIAVFFIKEEILEHRCHHPIYILCRTHPKKLAIYRHF